MFARAVAVAGALMLGVFAVTTDVSAQGVGSHYRYAVAPSGNLAVGGAPTTGGARANPATGPQYFNASPPPSSTLKNGSSLGLGGPYTGTRVINR